jgi:hypothetical protein
MTLHSLLYPSHLPLGLPLIQQDHRREGERQGGREERKRGDGERERDEIYAE